MPQEREHWNLNQFRSWRKSHVATERECRGLFFLFSPFLVTGGNLCSELEIKLLLRLWTILLLTFASLKQGAAFCALWHFTWRLSCYLFTCPSAAFLALRWFRTLFQVDMHVTVVPFVTSLKYSAVWSYCSGLTCPPGKGDFEVVSDCPGRRLLRCQSACEATLPCTCPRPCCCVCPPLKSAAYFFRFLIKAA